MKEDELIEFTVPMLFRSYEDCVDENLFNQHSFQLIKSKMLTIKYPIYKQWKENEITLDKFARSTASFVRGWCEPMLEEILVNTGRIQNEIPDLLNRFWNLFEEKVRQQPHVVHTFSDYTYVVLKKM
ncbi:unnamed protein product [Adineta ricciae]|nr:unnamed protein product [Adineta ricciae]